MELTAINSIIGRLMSQAKRRPDNANIKRAIAHMNKARSHVKAGKEEDARFHVLVAKTCLLEARAA